MADEARISALQRMISGVLGVLGFAAIAFRASQDQGLEIDLMRVASFLAGFIFLYVSFFGKYPWDVTKSEDPEE